MKLTKLQRYTIYCIMLAEFNEEPDGLCLIWYHIFDERRWHNDDNNLRYILPEIWEKGNKNVWDRAQWFSSPLKRLAALEACVEETHP